MARCRVLCRYREFIYLVKAIVLCTLGGLTVSRAATVAIAVQALPISKRLLLFFWRGKKLGESKHLIKLERRAGRG